METEVVNTVSQETITSTTNNLAVNIVSVNKMTLEQALALMSPEERKTRKKGRPTKAVSALLTEAKGLIKADKAVKLAANKLLSAKAREAKKAAIKAEKDALAVLEAQKILDNATLASRARASQLATASNLVVNNSLSLSDVIKS